MIRAFKWYGGKLRVVNEILALVPPHTSMWYEVCCGSCAVTLNKATLPIEVVNDLDGDLVNFWRILADREQGAELVERLLKLYCSPREFVRAKIARQNHWRGMGEMTRAVLTFVLISQSFNAERLNYRSGVSQADYRDSNLFHLPQVYERMQGVKVTNLNATTILDRMRNTPEAFIYADLPYLHNLRTKGACSVYGKEMKLKEHVAFLETARNAKCAVMICGYRNEQGFDLYDSMLLGHGKWRHLLLAELPKSCQSKAQRDTAREWVWINYDPPAYAKYNIDLSSANW
jgi:DNA adenine methylase